MALQGHQLIGIHYGPCLVVSVSMILVGKHGLAQLNVNEESECPFDHVGKKPGIALSL